MEGGRKVRTSTNPVFDKFAKSRNGQISKSQQHRGRPASNHLEEPAQEDRSRATSKKRKLENEKAEDTNATVDKHVKPNRPPPKGGTGGSGRAGAGKLVSSFEMFVGRTHPETTESDIRELVVENTLSDTSEGVKLENVECISELKDDDGKILTKGWKVSMNFSDKDRMMQESSWPAGWSFRQYFPPKRKPVELYKPGVKLA